MNEITMPVAGAAPEAATPPKNAPVADATSIRTGVTSSIKGDSINATKANAAKMALEAQQAAKVTAELSVGQTLYTVKGGLVFNCFTDKGKPICFAGGCFIVEESDPNAKAYIEALDYHVSTGSLTKTIGE